MNNNNIGKWNYDKDEGDWLVMDSGFSIIAIVQEESDIDPEKAARLIAASPDLVIELRQAIIQMEMAAECIEKGRYDEALLHVSSLMRSKKEVLAKATGESA